MTAPVKPKPGRSWRPRVPKRVATYFDEHRILKYVIYCGLGAFLLGYVFIALLFFPFGKSPIVTVPDVRGRTEAQARRAFGRVDLELKKGETVAHPTIRSGRVVAQVPLPGQEASRGTEVSVILSSGPEQRAVPSITGMGKDDAIALLQRMGFQVRLRMVKDNSPEGGVLGMEPKAGTRVAVPSPVVLILSAGPPKVVVPSVLTLPEPEARARLEAAGLRLGTITYDSNSREPLGGIASQSPAAGDSLRMGGAVRVVISGSDPTPEPFDDPEEPDSDEPEPEPDPAPEPGPEPADTARNEAAAPRVPRLPRR